MHLASLYRVQFLALLAALGCSEGGCCGVSGVGDPVCNPGPSSAHDSDAGHQSAYSCAPPQAGISSTGPACACVKDLQFSCFHDHAAGKIPVNSPVPSDFSSLFVAHGTKKMLHVIVADVALNCASCLDELCWANTALDADSALAADVDLMLLSINDSAIVHTLPVKGCYQSLNVSQYKPLCFDADPLLGQVKSFFNLSSINTGNSPVSVLIRYADMKIIYYGDKRFQNDWIGVDGGGIKAAQQYTKYLNAIAANSICPIVSI